MLQIFFNFAYMTLQEAFIQFTESENYKEVAKLNNAKGAKYRIYLSRFQADKLRSGAIVELLIANGYEIRANKARKKK